MIDLRCKPLIESMLHGCCDPGQEHASSATQSPAKPFTLAAKPFTVAAKPVRTGYGTPKPATSQIWQQATCTEPKTALSRSTMY